MSAVQYGGDEINAVVVDVGSHTVKAGYSGEDVPKAVFPSCVGEILKDGDNEDKKDGDVEMKDAPKAGEEGGKPRKLFVGNTAMSFRRDGMEVVPSMKDGVYSDWDVLEALWDHAFTDRLRIDAGQYAVMLSEPTYVAKETREKVVQILFEKFKVPALFLSKNAVLSSFAMGRQTSLVVDSGHEGTVVAAVHDGYVLNKSIQRAPVGGALLTRCMQSSVEKAMGGPIRPRYAFKRVDKDGTLQVEDLSDIVASTTDSYRDYCTAGVAADIKETMTRVSDTRFVEAENENIPTQTYELPDGTEVSIGPDRFKVPEVLFQPSLAAAFPGGSAVNTYAGTEAKGIHDMAGAAIAACDVDIRRELYSGIVLTGGSSMFPAIKERLEREVNELAPQAAKVKVYQPPNQQERLCGTWIGGSILASLGSFQQMWMSKQEFEEHGAAIIHRKSP